MLNNLLHNKNPKNNKAKNSLKKNKSNLKSDELIYEKFDIQALSLELLL